MKKYYFDYNSTSPVSKNVRDVVVDTLENIFANPSTLYREGVHAKKIIDRGRGLVAEAIGANKDEIYFVSSGTEANNLALKGMQSVFERGQNHIIVSNIEHSSIFQTALFLEKRGVEVTYVPVDKTGLLDIDFLKNSIKETTSLISIMTANNETGVIQDIKQISSIARTYDIVFHSDGVQALGKIPVNVNDLGVDMLSLSAHKIYGPKGIGALYIRKGISLTPLIHGGGQESKVRSGTENVPLIAGFGEACRNINKDMLSEGKRLLVLKTLLYRLLCDKVEKTKLNGTFKRALPNTLNMSFPGCESETLILELDISRFSVSSGAACSSLGNERFRVLKAMGLNSLEQFSTLRFSMGKDTSEKDVILLSEKLSDIIGRLAL